MSWKLLRFKPLKPFFFGKQRVFTNTNFAASEYFPQQTQLVGALRAHILESNGLLKVHRQGKFCSKESRKEALELLGSAGSFDFDRNDDLGKLQAVSPIFLVKHTKKNPTDLFFPLPQDLAPLDGGSQERKRCRMLTPKKLSFGATLLEGYDVKQGLCSGLGNACFWHKYTAGEETFEYYDFGALFVSYEQVGIGLENKRVVEGRFYTKRSYMLKEEFAFGVFVKYDGEIAEGTVAMGAENATFRLSVSDIPQTLEKHPLTSALKGEAASKGEKVVLLGDAMRDESIDAEATFQIVPESVKFRMMLPKEKRHMPSTEKTQEKLLVPGGSVYYYEKAVSFPQAPGAYAKMGFNRYLAINQKGE